MMYMTNEEYQHYIFEMKRKGRDDAQIAESMGMQLEDFVKLQNKVFGITESEPAVEKVPENTDAEVKEPVSEPEMKAEEEPEPVVEEEEAPTETAAEPVTEDDSWMD